ncbi:MAG: hypothetical protein JJE25_12385 [Bacteroidia bacterium]|nr:hypothetical protein [Bacteroidia bacterium]
MKKYLIAIAAIVVISLSSCYVRVRHPHPRGVIILSGDNTAPKDSLKTPVISEPAK